MDAWGILCTSLTRPSYVTNLLWKHVRGGKNSDHKHNVYTCDQEREPCVGCGHHHRCRAGLLTIQVVDDFVPGGAILGYEVINLLQNSGAHKTAELRYTWRQAYFMMCFVTGRGSQAVVLTEVCAPYTWHRKSVVFFVLFVFWSQFVANEAGCCFSAFAKPRCICKCCKTPCRGERALKALTNDWR